VANVARRDEQKRAGGKDGLCATYIGEPTSLMPICERLRRSGEQLATDSARVRRGAEPRQFKYSPLGLIA